VVFNDKHDRVTISFDYARDVDLILARPSFTFRIYEQREATKPAAVVQGFQQSVEESNAAPARRYQQDIKKSLGGAPGPGATGDTGSE
jgi:hypothetical protein